MFLPGTGVDYRASKGALLLRFTYLNDRVTEREDRDEVEIEREWDLQSAGSLLKWRLGGCGEADSG